MSVTDLWTADPSWPPEQQRLFQRLKERFANQLGLKGETPRTDLSPQEERDILDKIKAKEGRLPLDPSPRAER